MHEPQDPKPSQTMAELQNRLAMLNAHAEWEAHDGPANDELLSAEDFTSSAVGLQGTADRLATTGTVGLEYETEVQRIGGMQFSNRYTSTTRV